ncbi:hypothetical protein K474DRAFT_1657193 [Panus rudis PR-1116 ss-1]|nr:hypothetical protein K474DRAFT_1657193 [Panus rudis PR-1116 ss-1]
MMATPLQSMNQVSGPPRADALQRSSDVWFDDGNVVIVAQGTAFRVHRGVVARKSDIFRDMFSIPQPAASLETEMYDGCPVVHVSDSRVEVMLLLAAMYDIDSKIHDVGSRMPAAHAEALLKLAAKYEVPHIQRSVIKRFEIQFPATFERFLARLKNEGGVILNPLLVKNGDIFSFIHIMRSHGLNPRLLPAAYHAASRYPFADMITAVNDGRWSLSEMEPCLRIREQLLASDYDLLQHFLDQPIPSTCENYPGCKASMDELLEYISRYVGLHASTIFERGLDWMENKASSHALCEECVGICSQWYRQHMSTTWDKLVAVC